MNTKRFPTVLLLAMSLAVVLVNPVASAAEWKAGAAKAKITPSRPIWMSGYASRTRPADDQPLSDLWAKALVLEDPQGKRAVLVTMDLVGIPRDVSQRVRQKLQAKHHLERGDIALCVSHTHSGPIVGDNLRAMYALDEAQERRVDDYTNGLEGKLAAVVEEAMGRLAPATLEWGVGRATFAVNRRNNPEPLVPTLRADGKLQGPVDHDLPVLVVRNDNGEVSALAFGYACHATVLNGYQWCGDWPGYAQAEVETAHPGAAALFWAGCGADQNPLPRRSVDLAQEYGRQAAAGVRDALAAGLRPIDGGLATAYSEIDLPFGELPTRDQLRKDMQSQDVYVARRAKLLSAKLDRDGRLDKTYPYPVQVWKLGDGPTWVLLGGEVVADYSLRLKKELGPERTWVAAYANDVMAYIPSLRVLEEGGYEGGGAMVYYGLPAPWGAEVEERIVKEVHRMAEAVERSGAQQQE